MENELLTSLGVSGGTLAIILAVRQILELIAKLIPDDATGALGVLRRVAKLLAVYTVSRKTSDDRVG